MCDAVRPSIDGFLRKEVQSAVFSFLECGIPENGVARVRCAGCGHDFFVAFAWLLANDAVSSVIAEATKIEQVISNSKSVGWDLVDEEVAEVDAILNSV